MEEQASLSLNLSLSLPPLSAFRINNFKSSLKFKIEFSRHTGHISNVLKPYVINGLRYWAVQSRLQNIATIAKSSVGQLWTKQCELAEKECLGGK